MARVSLNLYEFVTREETCSHWQPGLLAMSSDSGDDDRSITSSATNPCATFADCGVGLGTMALASLLRGQPGKAR